MTLESRVMQTVSGLPDAEEVRQLQGRLSRLPNVDSLDTSISLTNVPVNSIAYQFQEIFGASVREAFTHGDVDTILNIAQQLRALDSCLAEDLEQFTALPDLADFGKKMSAMKAGFRRLGNQGFELISPVSAQEAFALVNHAALATDRPGEIIDSSQAKFWSENESIEEYMLKPSELYRFKISGELISRGYGEQKQGSPDGLAPAAALVLADGLSQLERGVGMLLASNVGGVRVRCATPGFAVIGSLSLTPATIKRVSNSEARYDLSCAPISKQP